MSPEVVARDVGPKGRARCGLVGTMEFMSPEVVAREEAQAASDMWSVGVLVFMMVSGGLSPFWAGSDAGTEERLGECRYRLDQPHFRHVSPQAIQLIQSLLVLDPRARLSSGGALRHQWLTLSVETARLTRDSKIETALLRRHNARFHWGRLRYAIIALRCLRGRVGREYSTSQTGD